MSKEVVKGLAKVSLLVVMTMIATVATRAQSLQYKLTANIPFDFTVGEKKLTAGEYSVRRAQQLAGDLILQIESTDGQANVTRLTFAVTTRNPEEKARLVFHRYGNEYFLSEIWPAGGSTGRELPKSRPERELQQRVNDGGIAGMKAPDAETVTVVVNQR
jgi:hypothetical protein